MTNTLNVGPTFNVDAVSGSSAAHHPRLQHAASGVTRIKARHFSRYLIAIPLILTVMACAPAPPPEVDVQDPALVTAGEPLYAANCAACHGIDLRGTESGPSHLSVIYEPGRHTDFAFLQAVKFGSQPHHWSFGAMPAIAGLSDEDVEMITAFVRERQRTQGFESYPP